MPQQKLHPRPNEYLSGMNFLFATPSQRRKLLVLKEEKVNARQQAPKYREMERFLMPI